MCYTKRVILPLPPMTDPKETPQVTQEPQETPGVPGISAVEEKTGVAEVVEPESPKAPGAPEATETPQEVDPAPQAPVAPEAQESETQKELADLRDRLRETLIKAHEVPAEITPLLPQDLETLETFLASPEYKSLVDKLTQPKAPVDVPPAPSPEVREPESKQSALTRIGLSLAL